MIRALLLLLALGGLGYWLREEQQRGRFNRVDEPFLDILLANVREEVKPDPAHPAEVVLVRLREEDKAEYDAWPPRPIDYQMLLQGLAASQPRLLVIADTLAWPGEPKPDFIAQAGEALVPFERVVLAATAATDQPSTDPLPERLAVIESLEGNAEALPALARMAALPEPAIARYGDLGLVVPEQKALAYRSGSSARPSLELAALAQATATPFTRQRLRAGPGAGLHLGERRFIPLQPDGSLPAWEVKVTEINALDVLTAKLTNDDAELRKTLGTGKVIVLGMDHDGGAPGVARRCATSLAAMLALPEVKVLPQEGQWAAWGVAALLGLTLLARPRTKALPRALLYLFAAVVASYLAFLTTRVWCPPTIPAALIAASGLLVRIIGRAPAKE